MIKRAFIRGVWGDVSNNGIRNGKLRKDIDAARGNKNISMREFDVYVFGKENYDALTAEGFNCRIVNDNPCLYDMERQLYRHKLDVLSRATWDYDEIVYLDWDCVPVAPIPDDFWEVMSQKAPFQANLFQYRTKKCLWRSEDHRKVCNGGFLYIREPRIIDEFLRNYSELYDWVEQQRKSRELKGKKLRFREEALIFDDEPAISKWIDDDMDGWKGIDLYWEKYEPVFCNLKNKSVYSKEMLNNKRACFVHWG
jgi:hypothetical protein